MGLVIRRSLNEDYFLIVAGNLKLWDYIRIRKSGIDKGEYGFFAEDCIEAPNGIIILRKELVDDCGGLENVINQIK